MSSASGERPLAAASSSVLSPLAAATEESDSPAVTVCAGACAGGMQSPRTTASNSIRIQRIEVHPLVDSMRACVASSLHQFSGKPLHANVHGGGAATGGGGCHTR